MNWERSEQFEEWPGCFECAHYRHGRCAAYPERIPLTILSGEVDHLVPRPGQVDAILFEPMDREAFLATGKRVPAQAAPAKRRLA